MSSQVIKSEIVTAFCYKKGHGYCEHVEYTKKDGTKKYVCRLCKSETPYAYPIYGRQSPSVSPRSIDTSTPDQYGRQVA